MHDDLVWVDVPGYEDEYKVALYRSRLIVFTKRKERPLKAQPHFTLSKNGKQTIFSEAKLKRLCGFI